MSFKARYQKIRQWFYDVGGFTFLASVAGLLFVSFILMVFFWFNRNWIAPTHLSLTSKDGLEFASGYQQAQQNYLTLKLANSQANRELGISIITAQNLQDLGKQTINYNDGLHSIRGVKDVQYVEQQGLIKRLDDLAAKTQQDAQRGLVTNDTLIQILSTVAQFKATSIDGRTNWATTNITASAGAVQLTSQLLQAKSDVATKAETVWASDKSLKTAQKTLDALEHSAYFAAFQNGSVDLAFLDYHNDGNVKIGSPVYDCYAIIVLCRRVGTVTALYDTEQIIEFPLFNVRFSRSVRGHLIKTELTNPGAATSMILFAGHKPLLF